jgi:GTP-binding protein Era
MADDAPLRSGLVALAGRPNVGKSTLANALAGAHVAAVSERPQTTRRRVLAVARGDGWQAVLLDLPGFQRPADRLTERMQETVDRTVADTDAALFVLNAAEDVGGGDRFIAQRLRSSGLPVVVVVNQVDRVERDRIAQVILQATELVPDFLAIHPVSALTGEGLDALRAEFPSLLPEGPQYFPEGVSTDQTQEEMAAEMIREAAIQRLRDEVPHALAVQVEEIDDARRGVRIEAYVFVETESQKGIVVGKGGRMIRDIGTQARHVLSESFGQPVHLDLQVKVRPRWRRDDAMLDRLGL